MITTIQSGTIVGVESKPVAIEVHLGRGLPGADIVGLPEATTRESRVRVKAAIMSSGFELAKRHVVLNVLPADTVKYGASLDLALALGALAADYDFPEGAFTDTILVGELSLAGELRPVRGVLAHLRAAANRGVRYAIVPASCASEASFAIGIKVYAARYLADVVAHLSGRGDLPVVLETPVSGTHDATSYVDLADVKGQTVPKRALEIAAAGGHHLLMVGPPGTGKTMLARRLTGLLPTPDEHDQRDIATIASVAGVSWSSSHLPFRAPHHTASGVAIVGGGDPIRPGEVTLAHHGVLFLDELPEFRRPVLESLSSTLAEGRATIVTMRQRVTMPARPLVIAAMNPCPCGFSGDVKRVCTCTSLRVDHYRNRIGAVRHLFALHVQMGRPDAFAVHDETSVTVRARVEAARAFGDKRMRDMWVTLDGAALRALDNDSLHWPMSSHESVTIVAVARTIADLALSEEVTADHMREALTFRMPRLADTSTSRNATTGA